MPTQIPLNKTPAQVQAGYADLTATVDDANGSDVLMHVWRLVYRWGKRRPVFAAEATIEGCKVQLHRYIHGLNGSTGKGFFVIPKDGNALNCIELNLRILTREQWETRNHRTMDKPSDMLSEEEMKWLDDNSVAKGQTRGSIYRRGLRLLMAQSDNPPATTPPITTTPAPNEFD